jgi:beta-glucuronidase
MKLLPLVLTAFVSAVSASAEPVFLIGNVDGRKTQSLDGAWNIIIDPYEMGYYDFHLHPNKNGYFKNEKPKTPLDLVEYDFDKSPTLRVPGDWNTQRESLFFYEGTVWYKKSFTYQPKPGTRQFLYFGAANYEAIAYLNGEKLGEHIGGFTPFNFEVTKLLHEGENFVVVKVDNKRHLDAVPTVNTDWWNYGGLTRSVRLVEVPETFIEDAAVQLAKGSLTDIVASVRLRGTKLGQKVMIEIPEAKAAATVTTDANGAGTVRFKAKLDLWSPEHPKLYDVKIAAETDSMNDQIGFRTVEVRGEDILLNGKPVFLRGISMHEEAPYRGGRGLSAAESRTLLGWVKELGGNFVRLAHYPHDENTTREADRLGILVWSEIPVYWTVQFTNPASYDNARNQLEENITRDRNRASIIIWSVANETPLEEARTKFLARLADEARRLDPTRLVSAALLIRRTGDTVAMDDPLSASLDVIGCNEYFGWYGPEKMEVADTLTWTSTYGKPLIISEFGADARYGNHGDPGHRWTEEYQESLYNHQVGMLKRITFLRGMSPWILMDFRSPRRQLPGIQDYWNRKGLLSERGERKKAFFVLQKFYKEMAEKYPAR